MGKAADIGLIYVCQPGYHNGHPKSHKQFWDAAFEPGSPLKPRSMMRGVLRQSLLARGFNGFLCEALNRRLAGENITHFVMLHDDVTPEDGWVDKLVREQLKTDYELLSVVVPIKDGNGLTSTAVSDPHDDFQPWRRLTLHEVLTLPETFDITNIQPRPPGSVLLVNTGCFVLDLTAPWLLGLDTDGTLATMFTVRDQVRFIKGGNFSVVDVNGHVITSCLPSREAADQFKKSYGLDHAKTVENDRLVCYVESEDWYFSKRVAERRGRIGATRKVRVGHWGEVEFNNQEDWGLQKYDQYFAANCDHKPIYKGVSE